jgi:hypothetical protein
MHDCGIKWTLFLWLYLVSQRISVMLHRNQQYYEEKRRLLFPVIFTKGANVNSLKEVCPGLANFIESSFMPLFLSEEKYLYVNQAFKESVEYNTLKATIREFLDYSVVPAIMKAPPWENKWGTKEWWDDPGISFNPKIDCLDFFRQPLMS